MGRFIVLFGFLFSINLYAMDFEYSFFFTPRFQSIHNLDKLLEVGSFKEWQIYKFLGLQYEEGQGVDGDYPSVYTGGGISVDFFDQWTFNFGINTREISVKTVEPPFEGADSYFVQRWRDNFFIDEANLEWYPSDWFYLKAGQMLLNTGNGEILSSYQTAINTQFSFDNFFNVPLTLSIAFSPIDAYSSILPSMKTLLYLFELGYPMNLVDEIKFSFLHINSKDPWIIPSIYGRAYFLTGILTINASGNLNWTGVTWSKNWRKLSTLGTFFVEFGRATYTIEERDKRWNIQSTGFLFDGEVRGQVSRQFECSGFLFLSSGDIPVNEGDMEINYSSFISLLPLITRTNIFFNGGINSTFSSGTFYSSGVMGLGVIAPGAGFTVNFSNKIKLDFTAAFLLAYKKPPETIKIKPPFTKTESQARAEIHPERNYGEEFDFTFSYEILESLTATLEMDFFLPGDFYPDNYDLYDRNGRYLGNFPIGRDLVSQIIIGVDFSI